jgi:SHS family lactate transporter-like MFS transporter
METVRPQARGFVSGLLQSGYPSGYLLASVAYGLLYSHIGWRGLFMVGILPAVLILYIRRNVPESPAWSQQRATAATTLDILARHWQLALYAILLMTAFNFFSHGTQDLYPTFLQKQHHFDHLTVSTIAVVYNIGAILGGISFASFSQSFGRRRTMIVAALLSLPAIWLWAFSGTALLLGAGAFLVQFFVQGAWGVVPAHLNELSPAEARGTFPGTVYQLGNFIASSNAVLQARIAESHQNNYSIALAGVAIIGALLVALLAWLGREARDVDMIAPG